MTRETHNQARTTIIGVGGFGLYTVAHLAPRLRFINAQRRMANPDLPDLDRLVSYALLIPRRPDPAHAPDSPEGLGSIDLWIPLSQNIQEIGPFEIQDFRREADRFAQDLRTQEVYNPPPNPNLIRQHLDRAYGTWRAAHNVTDKEVFVSEIIAEALIGFMEKNFHRAGRCTLIGGSAGRVSRRDVLHSLEIEANKFGMQLEDQLSEAYHDLNQPMEQETQITTYVIASACDDWAGALLWPLGHLLRNRLSDYPVETVGLISTGPYSPPPYRAYEEASAYAALLELDYLSSDSVDENGRPGGHVLTDTPYESWELLRNSAGRPAFDRCYLLDAVKASRATAAGEHEVAVSIANAMELFMVGNGDQIVQEQLAAGLSLEQRTTYSALGASVKFLPIQKIQYWVQRRLAAEIVHEKMIGITDSEAAQLQEEGNQYAVTQGLTLEGMGRVVLTDVPVVLQTEGRGNTLPTFVLRDETALMPEVLQPVAGGRGRRVPPVEWYRLMSLHREELLRNELIRPLMQRADPDPLATTVSRQLGIWRLHMHLNGGTAETIELNTSMSQHSPGIYTAQHNNLDVVLTAATDQTASGEPITTARVIPYTERSYLGLPITEVRRVTDETYRRLMGFGAGADDDRSAVGVLQSELIRRANERITGDNKGLQHAQAWLRGVLTRSHDELERLPHDDRAEQAFQQDWNRRLIGLEQRLGGRPGPDGAPETRGLAQRRPETAALIARAVVAAGFLLFAGFTFLRRVQPVELAGWQTIGLVAAFIAGPFLLVGLFRLAYDMQVERFRRRTLALFQEQVDRQVTLSAIHAATAALRRMYGVVANLLGLIDRDIRTAEEWRDENLGERKFNVEDHSDTILRQAIGDEDLVEAVGQTNRNDRDKELEKIGNLWRWADRPAHETVMNALVTYAAFDPTSPQPLPAAGRRRGRASAAPQAPAPPPTLIWQWMRETAENVAGRYINQQNRYPQNIETYIARHPRSVMPPGHDTTDPAMQQNTDDSPDFLIDMGYLAKPYIFLEEVELTEPVVAIDLLGVDRHDQMQFNRSFLAGLRSDPRWSTHPPRVVSTFDPFSITYLRTLHGLPARSMSRWGRYRGSFANLGQRDRALVELLPTAAYEVGEPGPGADLFFDAATDGQTTP